MDKKGDCFQANALYIVNLAKFHSKNNKILELYRLCHGMVIGAKGTEVEGKTFIHVWIELGDDLFLDFSNGKQIITRKENLKDRVLWETVKRYTVKQAIENLLKYEHYGEWE